MPVLRDALRNYFNMDRIEESDHIWCDDRTLNRYEIWWIKEGSGRLSIDTCQHDITEDTICCLPPGTSCKFEIYAKIRGYFLSLSSDFFRNDQYFINDNVWTNVFIAGRAEIFLSRVTDMGQDTEALFGHLYRESRRQHHYKSQVIEGLLHLLTIYFSRMMSDTGYEFSPSRELMITQKFRALVKDHFVTKKQVTEYARDMKVSAKHLNRVVKQVMGVTASCFIHQHIVKEAKRMVVRSDCSMKEVAYALGFDDHNHFSRFFRNNCGMTFSDFKNISGGRSIS
ncbi:MAG TPA: helix-turn-helix domain-containing protein [Puia sp.]|jgi:AraC-like DNA-binding protein|nr:helix-turn-helix domain-containing protein [Puia sp.]